MHAWRISSGSEMILASPIRCANALSADAGGFCSAAHISGEKLVLVDVWVGLKMASLGGK